MSNYCGGGVFRHVGCYFAFPTSFRALFFQLIERINFKPEMSDDGQPPFMRHNLALAPLLQSVRAYAQRLRRFLDRMPINHHAR